jgi:hypothetical protein
MIDVVYRIHQAGAIRIGVKPIERQVVLALPFGHGLFRREPPHQMMVLGESAERSIGRRRGGAERYNQHPCAGVGVPGDCAAAGERRVIQMRREVDVIVAIMDLAQIFELHRRLLN